MGLHLNRGKSLLYIPSSCDASLSPLPPDVPVSHEGFCLLGCPIGPPDFCEEVLQDRVRKIKGSLAVLHDMGDSQLEMTLLRSCFALPKFSYVIRTCPPSHVNGAAKEFDWVMHEALQSIIGGPLSEWSWLKASLPSSRGGINLQSTSLHAPAAFLASSCVSQTLVRKMLGHDPGPSPHNSSTMAALSAAASRPDWVSLDEIDVPLHQHSLSVIIDEAVYQQLLSSASSTRPHAGDWLNGVPSAALGLLLHVQEFRCCLRYWLGMPLHSSARMPLHR